MIRDQPLIERRPRRLLGISEYFEYFEALLGNEEKLRSVFLEKQIYVASFFTLNKNVCSQQNRLPPAQVSTTY